MAELKRAYEINTDVPEFVGTDSQGVEDDIALYVAGRITLVGVASGFWEDVIGEWQRSKDSNFYKGFLGGASEVYESVKDEL